MLVVLKGGIFTALLLLTSAIDIRRRIIPNILCLLIACTGFILFRPMNLSGVLISLPFLLAALWGPGMGGGDVKLAAAMGFVLGVLGGIAAVIIGLAAMLLFYAGYFTVQRVRGRTCQKALPLAPFLSIGSIAVYFLSNGGQLL